MGNLHIPLHFSVNPKLSNNGGPDSEVETERAWRKGGAHVWKSRMDTRGLGMPFE